MNTSGTRRTAARVLVDQLVANGVRHVFTVPGESFLPVLDALRDSGITVTTCRQEGAAAMMAEAHGKATGQPGLCFVTRGPGATNASAGIHVAQQDSTPMILFVGQVERSLREREAFQELDYRAVFGPMTKWATELDDPDRMPEFVSRAFYTATGGRPGPVVIALPKDVLTAETAAPLAPPFEAVEAAPGADDLARLAGLIAEAERPVLVLGGSRWTEDACADIRRFAERHDLTVMTSYRRAPLFDALHPCYGGDLGLAPNPKLVARVKAADLLILLGGRLGEIPSQGYRLLDVPGPRTRLVHIHPGPEEIGRVYRPHLAINAAPARTAAALAGLAPQGPIRWSAETRAAHAEFLAWGETPTPQPGGVNLGAVITHLRDTLPRDAILCNGAGNYAAWIHRYFRFRTFAGHIAPTSASMGYGVPAAVAIKRLWPGRTVISINGDGDFLMNGQEFATAVQYGLAIVVIVADNGSYGTIRMHQEREFPGRVSATDLHNPDFAAYARAFGGFGATVETTAEFPDALAAAQRSGLPAILHLRISTDAITPGQTLTQIRERALAGG
ncbi:Acetolactate synthase isozyme 2 large subunit [Methylobacterium crusticola]|uniref:Acetolactate synthase isozyme 2 large subunit n=1 Tax=Methylobacterium crusticola TaxID=1697972 RepID=A0ABQ4QQB1_9HYPH|nr:thiamine pyrophosphate-binding protein [Methylobacterium crusticola]GJD47468.1 Acetolactate synthase isozyme 2 large subunit [Methylobacterium crusticola]